MKKFLLLFLSCVIFTTQINSKNLSLEPQIYFYFSGDTIPYAQKWFDEIKAKYPKAGFDDTTFLREGYMLDIFGERTAAGWFASHFDINPEIQTYFNKVEHIKIICGEAKDMQELNRICEIYYTDSGNLDLKDQRTLYEIEGVFLHEVYHCCCLPEPAYSFLTDYHIGDIALAGMLGAYLTKWYSNDNTTKATCSQIAKGCETLILSIFALVLTKTVVDKRQNEYEADINVIKHGSKEAIQGMKDHIIKFYGTIQDQRVCKTLIEKLKSMQENAWTINKSNYTRLITLLQRTEDLYIDLIHPAPQTRIEYLSKALAQ